MKETKNIVPVDAVRVIINASSPAAQIVERAARAKGIPSLFSCDCEPATNSREIYFWEFYSERQRGSLQTMPDGPVIVFGPNVCNLSVTEVLGLDLVLPRTPTFEEVGHIIDHFIVDRVARTLDFFSDRHSLSKREKETLGYGISGVHGKAGAAEMGCSVSTVDVYWHRICRKLDCRGRDEAIAMFFAAMVSPSRRYRPDFSRTPHLLDEDPC